MAKSSIIEGFMAELEKRAHWNVHFTGEDADKINLLDLIKETDAKVEVTSSSVNIYYNPVEKEKPKGSPPKK